MPVSDAPAYQLDRTHDLIVEITDADHVEMIGVPFHEGDPPAWYGAAAWRDGTLLDVEAAPDANTAAVRLLRALIGGLPCPDCGRKQVVWHAPEPWANRGTWRGTGLVDGCCSLTYRTDGWQRACCSTRGIHATSS